MKKIFVCIIVVMILLMNISVFAQINESGEADNNTISNIKKTEVTGEVQDAIAKKLDQVSNPPELSRDVQKYVEEFVEKRGIDAEEITSVTEVNFKDLPKEVNIENLDDTNLAIYKVEYNEADSETGEVVPEKIFVVTYSVEKLRAQGDLIVAQDKRQFLNFGFSGEMLDSGFLKTAAGVEGSLELGYVMMRSGSITGISTSLDVTSAGPGAVEIIIYKNGEAVRFGNSLDASSTRVKKDYDIQSKGIVTFEPGDVISVYTSAQPEADGIVWKDVITMIEITTTN